MTVKIQKFLQLEELVTKHAKITCGDASHYPYMTGFYESLIEGLLHLVPEKQAEKFLDMYLREIGNLLADAVEV